ncbi:MAG: hypothetical protein WCS69_15560 [Ignavibacteriaceae bacterium]|jgi:hypothetical protein
MAQKINYLVQDSDALLKAITNHRAAMEEKGFTEERLSTFVSAKDNLKLKEAAQQKAVKFKDDKTAEQDVLMKNIHAAIVSLRNAAKSAYIDNPQKLNIFQIGETIPTSVIKMRPMCEYLTGVIAAESAVLLKNGLSQADLDILGTSYNNLITADADQENAKKLQNAALLVRDKAAAVLREQVTKTRKFALACFAKSPEILVEFEPIPKGRGKGKDDDEDETPPPPDGTTPPAQ